MPYEGVESVKELALLYERVRTAEDRTGAYQVASVSDDMRTKLIEYVNGSPDLVVCASLTDSVVGSLISRNCGERDFYAQLASFVFDSNLLSDKGVERVVAFGLSMIDRRLPYRHYEVTTMDNELFTQMSETWLDEVREIRRIAHRPFLQKTEEASAVLEVIDNLEEPDVRCVLLAHYFDELRLENKQEEDERRP